ncbi:MAG TPA: hypothetical protein VFS62_18455 [Chloroflexota bacterium]|nr:hypothetical protein [Chloroflexota bacterium]
MRPVIRQRQLGQQARQRRTWALALAEAAAPAPLLQWDKLSEGSSLAGRSARLKRTAGR